MALPRLIVRRLALVVAAVAAGVVLARLLAPHMPASWGTTEMPGGHADEIAKADRTVEDGVVGHGTDEDEMDLELPNSIKVFPNVHAFYYAWYGTPKKDGQWIHWNHKRMPHWDGSKAAQFPQEAHKPPHDIGAKFYPAIGPYSSSDPLVIDKHMKMIQHASIGVIVVSWYHPSRADPNGISPDPVILSILNAAQEHGIKVTLHLEPYINRTAASMHSDLTYIFDRYAQHPAFYKHSGTRDGAPVTLPMFYIYDSYQTNNAEWTQLFTGKPPFGVRKTPLDAFFIGLLVTRINIDDLYEGGFDGAYTYFASEGFSSGSTIRLWPEFASAARQKNLLFIPSIGPGYDDTPIRPWNGGATRRRDGGKYMRQFFNAALALRPPVLSVTSFNEWGEGTQIESAQPFVDPTAQQVYNDYHPHHHHHYLTLMAQLALELQSEVLVPRP